MTIDTVPRLRYAAACALLLVAISHPSHAQDRLDPVAMGKARASVASARGIGAIASNPGALDLPTTHLTTLQQDLVVSLYNVGASIGSTYLSSSDFQQIFGKNGGWPNQAERERLSVLLQDKRLFANGANNLLTVRYRTNGGGTFGLHYGHRVFARLNFPDDFTKVIAKGELLAEHYRFINRGIAGLWMTELGLSYSKSIGSPLATGWFPTVSLGATVKRLGGVAHFEVKDDSYISVDQTTVGGTRAYVVKGGFGVRSALPDGLAPADAVGMFEAALFPATSGEGLSADVGVAGVLYRKPARVVGAAPRDAIYFGATIQDVGSVHWTDIAYDRSQTIDTVLVNGTISNDQFQKYQGTLVHTGGYITNLPMVVRAGLAVDVGAFVPDMSSKLVVDLEGELPMNQEVGNSTDPRLSLGCDWGVNDWLSLRTGVSGGGINGLGIGLGAGVRPLPWLGIDIGTSELNSFFTGDRVDLAFRLAVGF